MIRQIITTLWEACKEILGIVTLFVFFLFLLFGGEISIRINWESLTALARSIKNLFK